MRTPNRSSPQRKRKQRNREWTLEERIRLKLSATLVDPGFITFHGDFSFALTQDRFKEDTQSLDRTDRDNGERIILNEAHTFRDPVSVILRNRNAIVTTIVVTDTANRRVFQHGLDYSIIRQGNATRLGRIRTGRIADGDSVLVDYLIKTPAHGQLDTVRVDFSLEQRFSNGWMSYYGLGGPGDKPGSTPMPVAVAVAPQLPPSLAKSVPDDFDAAYFLFVANNLGRTRISLFAVGKKKP